VSNTGSAHSAFSLPSLSWYLPEHICLREPQPAKNINQSITPPSSPDFSEFLSLKYSSEIDANYVHKEK
jgi:hypothetical protein